MSDEGLHALRDVGAWSRPREREVPDLRQAPICRDLAIETFVDDRVDVLVPMAGIVRNRLLFGAAASDVAGIVPVPTWAHAEAAIVQTLERA